MFCLLGEIRRDLCILMDSHWPCVGWEGVGLGLGGKLGEREGIFVGSKVGNRGGQELEIENVKKFCVYM